MPAGPSSDHAAPQSARTPASPLPGPAGGHREADLGHSHVPGPRQDLRHLHGGRRPAVDIVRGLSGRSGGAGGLAARALLRAALRGEPRLGGGAARWGRRLEPGGRPRRRELPADSAEAAACAARSMTRRDREGGTMRAPMVLAAISWLICWVAASAGQAASRSAAAGDPGPAPAPAWRYLALGDSYTIGEGIESAGRWAVQLAALAV